MLAGVGAGKSYAGAWFAIKQVIDQPQAVGFIGANTYRQLHAATLNTLFSQLDRLGMTYDYNKIDGRLVIEDTKIYVGSLENYDAWRGIEIGWLWMDETRDTRKEAFEMLVGRMRDKNATSFLARLTSTPSGFNWLYDVFGQGKKDYELITATSMDNPHLPQSYLDSLKASYDSKLYAQEVLGQFVNTSQGRIYYGFERERNVGEYQANQSRNILIGMDFNINPMTAVVCEIENDVVYVVDEFRLMTSSTQEMCDAIKEKYGTGHRVIPDSTGKRITTSSAGYSDHEILRRNGFVVPHTRNPFRLDRYNAVNFMLEQKRLCVDSRCKWLIKDLEQVSYKEGTTLPDTSDSTLTHLSDALGYVLWWTYPMKAPTRPVGMVGR